MSQTRSGYVTKKLYQQLVERNGEICDFCGCNPKIRQLLVVRYDKEYGDELFNLRLYCRRCNSNRNSCRSGDKCVYDESESYLFMSRRKEREFRNYVYDRIRNEKRIYSELLIVEGSEIVGLSPVTTKRYLEKMCSKPGLLCKLYNGDVVIDRDHPLYKGEIEEYDGQVLRKPSS